MAEDITMLIKAGHLPLLSKRPSIDLPPPPKVPSTLQFLSSAFLALVVTGSPFLQTQTGHCEWRPLWGIAAAEAVRLTQSAPSLSGNRRQCGKKEWRPGGRGQRGRSQPPQRPRAQGQRGPRGRLDNFMTSVEPVKSR